MSRRRRTSTDRQRRSFGVGVVALVILASTSTTAVEARTPEPAPVHGGKLFQRATPLREAITKGPKSEIGRRNRNKSSAQLDELAADPTTWVDTDGQLTLVAIIGLLTIGFVLSAVSGVARGIQWLSNINMVLALVLMLTSGRK